MSWMVLSFGLGSLVLMVGYRGPPMPAMGIDPLKVN